MSRQFCGTRQVSAWTHPGNRVSSLHEKGAPRGEAKTRRHKNSGRSGSIDLAELASFHRDLLFRLLRFRRFR
jgi:hypothetical protein